MELGSMIEYWACTIILETSYARNFRGVGSLKKKNGGYKFIPSISTNSTNSRNLTICIMKPSKGKQSNSYIISSHANKQKVATESGGKMTKFRSLDDIPDSTDDNIWSAQDSNYEDQSNYDDYDNNHSDGKVADSYRPPYQPQPQQQIPVFRPTSNNKPVGATIQTGKAPPLPYESQQQRPGNVIASFGQHANLGVNEHQAPIPPKSKYFDYNNEQEEDETLNLSPQQYTSDERNTKKKSTGVPSPVKKMTAAAIPNRAAVPAAAGFVPPLPYNNASNNVRFGNGVNTNSNYDNSSAVGGVDSEDSSIYFSKKPRPVNFK